MATTQTLANRYLSVSLDGKGRIVSLKNRRTGTELVTHREGAEAWRVVVPTGAHTVEFLLGSKHAPKELVRDRRDDVQTLSLYYDHFVLKGKRLPVRAEFTLTLKDDAEQLSARVRIENRGCYPFDEVEFPILGGIGGFRTARKRYLRLVQGSDRGTFFGDILNEGLPSIGRESHHFARELETCMFANAADADDRLVSSAPLWLDLSGNSEGLFSGYGFQSPRLFAFKLEKHPKEVPNAPAHVYPEGTPRWIRLQGLHMPRIQPGQTWVSEPVVLAPHAGDWHAGLDRLTALRSTVRARCETPAWLADFVGWTEIIGWLYTGEIFHNYAQCAERTIRDAKVTGVNFVFYYGHTALGAEGADFDNSPCETLGGEAGFRRMIERLHRHGIRIMLLDHLHRWVNRNVPEYKRLGLERWAMRDAQGNLNTARWWKETGLSCLYLKGPTPEWIEMCPACPRWGEHYLGHVRRMIARDVDALELDTFNPGRCYNPAHPHAPGVDLLPAKLDFIREVREQAKRINPDFALFAETMSPQARSVVDGFYPNRYCDENGRIYRYLHPEIREQAVLAAVPKGGASSSDARCRQSQAARGRRAAGLRSQTRIKGVSPANSE